ncbi:hypothetical protein F8G81_07555 [Arthrobacter sp. CDRTa11]|uniref:hypothetical protein n=1 Tax=Arthrobacter sp. CDRTa11 TaxID=2651199 RepID=UPI002265E07B|nr:hypothetical protein [Arthrobacter sp. CDRTa11]UZX02489.1 hypothetical protein F8G81_07555 [Arthrobacter sp. CDRTa11]
MKRPIALIAVAASAFMLASCASATRATSGTTTDPSPSPAVAYFVGSYQCAVSGGSGFEIDDFFPGGRFDYSGGGALTIGADGTWATPTSAGTWLLRGNTITIGVIDEGVSKSVDIPGFPDTATAASTGSTLVIAHPTYSGDRTKVKARMVGGGFQLTNEDDSILDCARG